MDNTFMVSDDGTITLDLNLRKRLGDPSAYHKSSTESRKLFLFWWYQYPDNYVVICTQPYFERSPGYFFESCIKEGKVIIPEILAKPGQTLILDETASIPMRFKVV